MSVCFITPTVGERTPWLAECIDAVTRQTVPCEHLIEVDHLRKGPSFIRNRLASLTEATWLAFLDDDDLVTPDHAEVLMAHGDSADVVFSDGYYDESDRRTQWSRFTGVPMTTPVTRERLSSSNYIPIFALVRRELFLDVQGFPEGLNEDHGLWLRLLEAGARFRGVPRLTWFYRAGAWPRRSQLHGMNGDG